MEKLSVEFIFFIFCPYFADALRDFTDLACVAQML